MLVPPRSEAVRELISAFFDLLREEREASVRVVLGHFLLVNIHPYSDGNGRMGRFLMNAMLAPGGYPWTVIPLARRTRCMNALEAASAGRDIRPFAELLALLVARRRRRSRSSVATGPGMPYFFSRSLFSSSSIFISARIPAPTVGQPPGTSVASIASNASCLVAPSRMARFKCS
ncbi:MAG: Fic family protein [Burkholderiales bacterium]|nr:Fic family protein [Burkholderiales bacterium]